MSVRVCERKFCKNIMCDYAIAKYYICDECLDELRGTKISWENDLNETEVRDKIISFMESGKNQLQKDCFSTNEHFNYLLETVCA